MQTPIRKKHRWPLIALLIAVVLAGIGGGAWLLAERVVNPPDGPTPIVHIPQIPLPSPNAFDYDRKAAESLVDRDKIEQAELNGVTGAFLPPAKIYTLAEKKALVRENTKTIQLIHAGFAYPFVTPQYRTANFTLPYYAKMRAAARFLKFDGQIKAAQGDWAGEGDADLDAVRLGEDLPHGALEIGCLVGLACQAIGRRPVWGAIPHLTSAQARTAALRLEAIDVRHTPFVSVMQEEEWTEQGTLIAEFRKPHWRQALLDDDFREDGIEDSDASQNLHGLMALALRQSTKQSAYDTLTRYREEFVANARAPYAAHVPIPRVPLDPTNMIGFFAMQFDPYQSPYWKDCSGEAQNRLLMTALALRAYQLDHGTLPVSLNALVPHYLHAVPADPFALSGPLRYRRTGSQYVLYSIGPDGKDDGGKPIFDPSKPKPQYPGAVDERYIVDESSKGDIVAGINLG